MVGVNFFVLGCQLTLDQEKFLDGFDPREVGA